MINLILNSLVAKIVLGVSLVGLVFGYAYSVHLYRSFKYKRGEDKVVDRAEKVVEKETIKGGKPNEKQTEDGLDCALTGNPC